MKPTKIETDFLPPTPFDFWSVLPGSGWHTEDQSSTLAFPVPSVCEIRFCVSLSVSIFYHIITVEFPKPTCVWVIGVKYRSFPSGFVSFKTRSHLAQTILEVTMQPRLTLNFWSSCLPQLKSYDYRHPSHAGLYAMLRSSPGPLAWWTRTPSTEL